MSTRELVDALIAGDSIAIENTFNTVMSQRISSGLDSRKIEVAQSMFVPQEQSTDTTVTDDNTQ